MTGDQVVDAALIVPLLSFLIPPIVSFFRARETPVEIVGVIVFVVCFAGAGLAMFMQNQILNPPAFADRSEAVRYYIGNFVAVFVMAKVWYSGFWQTIGASLTARLEQIGPKPGDPAP